MWEFLAKEVIKLGASAAKKPIEDFIRRKNEDLEKEKLKTKQNKRITDKITEIKIPEYWSNDEKNIATESLWVDYVFMEDKSLIALMNHIQTVKEWSEYVNFSDMIKRKKVSEIYVDLDTYLIPSSKHFSTSEKNTKNPLLDTIFQNSDNAIILGAPGAGKTTSLRKICSKFYNNENSNYKTPILIKLRDIKYSSESSIYNILKTIFIFEISSGGSMSEEGENLTKNMERDAFYAILNSLNVLLILDGFDEVQKHEWRQSILAELREISRQFKESKLILTCRTGEFNYSLENCSIYEISPLSNQQIETFSRNWLVEEEAVKRFVQGVKESPFADTSIKPLSLAHLCAIFERTDGIPDRPKTVYKKIVSLLIDEWDEQRSIQRSSEYSRFGPDRKLEFLSQLAYHLTVTGLSTAFTERGLVEAYENIHMNFGLPSSEALSVAKEVESHTGLLLRTGYDTFEFAHKSLQEYLSAEYLVKLPSLDSVGSRVEALGAELAVATSISSNPSLYFADIVLGVIGHGRFTRSFYEAFSGRLVSERPDFYPSSEMNIAALCFLALNGGDPRTAKYFVEKLGSVDLSSVSEFYDAKSERDKVVVLRRKKAHDVYKIPESIALPISVSEYFDVPKKKLFYWPI